VLTQAGFQIGDSDLLHDHIMTRNSHDRKARPFAEPIALIAPIVEASHGMAPCFSTRTLTFLRALKRHNNREWFRAKRAEYETHVRTPMIEVIERLARDLPSFAPDLAATPKDSLFRIYRDTRFSGDKQPLKTHVAASFTSRRLPRRAGAGLYFHIDPNTDREVWIGGGTYAPEPHELTRIREHLASHHIAFRALVESTAFRKTLGGLEGERLTRVPRGFAADHPAAEYLKFKQLYAGRSYDVEFARHPRFYATLLNVFRLVAPLVAFLNAPLVGAREESVRDPLMPVLGRARSPKPGLRHGSGRPERQSRGEVESRRN
jgi:uncharacterized protein (TIGR02453 family)